uniref:Granulin a n=1 Tax=Oryzias sinensis TaxID=183150 RepID=A0A8C7YJ17_9TELE
MQKWVVICWVSLALVGADMCPNGGKCEKGQTCCQSPSKDYDCCPFDEAECCGDHIHCCPKDTLCDMTTSSCGNATLFQAASAHSVSLQSFRMIRSYMGEDEDNICPDQSRCPAEFSCLKALTRYGCCPLAQGVSCPDGKHCCPEGHQCSLDSRSCVKKGSKSIKTVLCKDGVSECPDETTCCETQEGKWACCPMPKAVCCDDKIHCCPEETTCDVEQMKCLSSSDKALPMWAKFPARTRADWENQKVKRQKHGNENPTQTSNSFRDLDQFCFLIFEAKNVPCDETAACPDQTTCCKTQEGGWACCPLPEAVCCEDFIHCCPKGQTCNLAAQTCDGDGGSVPMLEKVPSFSNMSVKMEDVPCDGSTACPDQTTCCKTQEGGWACCPLPEVLMWFSSHFRSLNILGSCSTVRDDQSVRSADRLERCPLLCDRWACCPLPEAVCCDDHEHCCPTGTTCDLATLSCLKASGLVPMSKKLPASTWTSSATSHHTQCPQHTTCCFMKQVQKWGCCPDASSFTSLQAVCCADGEHCCPADYKCKEENTSCVKGEVVIPWYTKIPATDSIQADSSFVQCSAVHQCPEHMSCCRLFTGEWGCCPLPNVSTSVFVLVCVQAVCCGDKEHCCPEGYTCDLASKSCHKLLTLQLETVPLTPVFLPDDQSQRGPVKPILNRCDDVYSCNVDETCCRTSHTTWGCCLSPNVRQFHPSNFFACYFPFGLTGLLEPVLAPVWQRSQGIQSLPHTLRHAHLARAGGVRIQASRASDQQVFQPTCY